MDMNIIDPLHVTRRGTMPCVLVLLLLVGGLCVTETVRHGLEEGCLKSAPAFAEVTD
jgi:hypothetical protein